jgi:Transposase IS4
MNVNRVESVASVRNRNRFVHIKKNSHIVDNAFQLDASDPNHDLAFEVRPLLDIRKENFRSTPKEEELEGDEHIISFKGKCSMKQHMPKNPIVEDIKCFF